MRDQLLTMIDIDVEWQPSPEKVIVQYEMSCPTNKVSEVIKTIEAFCALYPNVHTDDIEIVPGNGYHLVRGKGFQ